MGDIGVPVAEEHLKDLEGQVDVLLALAGTHATIALDELDKVIDRLKPKVVIPMRHDPASAAVTIMARAR